MPPSPERRGGRRHHERHRRVFRHGRLCRLRLAGLWRCRPRAERASRLDAWRLSPAPARARGVAAAGRAAAMTRKRRRLLAVLAGMCMLGIAAALVLNAFSDSLVFFYSPSDLKTKAVPQGRMLRIGGLVEDASVQRAADGKT